jgi:hypothetical protein
MGSSGVVTSRRRLVDGLIGEAGYPETGSLRRDGIVGVRGDFKPVLIHLWRLVLGAGCKGGAACRACGYDRSKLRRER